MKQTNKTEGKTSTESIGVTEMQIKDYVVVWHYMANYGETFVKARSPTEAIKNHLFFKRKDIKLIAFENNNETSAIKDFGSLKVLNPKEAEN